MGVPISTMTPATTPLTGDEEIPIVQNGINKICTPLDILGVSVAAEDNDEETKTMTGTDGNKAFTYTGVAQALWTLPANAATTFYFTVTQDPANSFGVKFAAASGATLNCFYTTHNGTSGPGAQVMVRVLRNTGGSAAEYLISGQTATLV